MAAVLAADTVFAQALAAALAILSLRDPMWLPLALTLLSAFQAHIRIGEFTYSVGQVTDILVLFADLVSPYGMIYYIFTKPYLFRCIILIYIIIISSARHH